MIVSIAIRFYNIYININQKNSTINRYKRRQQSTSVIIKCIQNIQEILADVEEICRTNQRKSTLSAGQEINEIISWRCIK